MATLTRTLTYVQLVAAIAAGTLNKGKRITISDYQTIHRIPNTTDKNTGEIEPLLVTAISNNELQPEAYSTAFPDDIIYYNPVNDQSKVRGCTKGYIYRRIDTKQSNDFPFDFRQVKFRRWQIDQPAWNNATKYSIGQVVKHPSNVTLLATLHDVNTNNAVGSNNAHWRQFEWNNLSYVAWSPECFSSDKVRWFLTPTANYQDYKMFAVDSYYNSAISNKIEMPDGNLLEQSNTVIFGANFNSNSIGADFQENIIADNFNNVSGNSVGVDFTAATHVYANYTCTLFKKADGTQRVKYCNNSDVEVIVDANA